MTFKNCVACGARQVIWDLNEDGKCVGACKRRERVQRANGHRVEKSIGNLVGRLHEKYGFMQPEDGSENRYDARCDRQPAARHAFWWWLHNCVAHPLIGLVPWRFAFEFHDWTSRKLHGK